MALMASACSGGDTVPDGIDSGCMGVSMTITAADDHVHDVDVPDMDTVRGRAETYLTTIDGGHTHHVTITVTEFEQINQGNIVFMVTSRSAGHTHPVAIGCSY